MNFESDKSDQLLPEQKSFALGLFAIFGGLVMCFIAMMIQHHGKVDWQNLLGYALLIVGALIAVFGCFKMFGPVFRGP